jgi:hypothetical protein
VLPPPVPPTSQPPNPTLPLLVPWLQVAALLGSPAALQVRPHPAPQVAHGRPAARVHPRDPAGHPRHVRVRVVVQPPAGAPTILRAWGQGARCHATSLAAVTRAAAIAVAPTQGRFWHSVARYSHGPCCSGAARPLRLCAARIHQWRCTHGWAACVLCR